MKIVSVQSHQYYKTPAFKGLWGKPDEKIESNDAMLFCYTSHFYYPFKDESKMSIDRAVTSKSDRYKAEWYETGGGSVDTESIVYVKDILPFTEEEYKNYKREMNYLTQDKEKKALVENALNKYGLYEYLNPAPKQDKGSKEGFIDSLKRLFGISKNDK